MSWSNPKGFDFRATSGFVSDPAGNTYDLGDSYPTSKTLDGDTFNIGWSTSQTGLSRDRNAAVDARFAGINQRPNAGIGVTTWRIDLPSAGQYTIRIGMGDEANPKSNYWRILDNATLLATFGPVATTAAQFADATGVVRTSIANWNSSNVAATYTFASTICLIELGDPAQLAAGDTGIATFNIVAAASASPARPLLLLGVG